MPLFIDKEMNFRLVDAAGAVADPLLLDVLTRRAAR